MSEELALTYVRLEGDPPESSLAFHGLTIKESVVAFAKEYSGVNSGCGLKVVVCVDHDGQQWPLTVKRKPAEYEVLGMRGGE